jgi:hypothetical protein
VSATLQFTVRIHATRPHVWHVMLDDPTYRAWTSAFCEGSYYEGSWDEGARIRFLSSDGRGMASMIEAHRPHEFLAIHHLAEIDQGVERPFGPGMAVWGEARETYRLRDVDGVTEMMVECGSSPEFDNYLREAWPKALAILKDLCEAGPDAV